MPLIQLIRTRVYLIESEKPKHNFDEYLTGLHVQYCTDTLYSVAINKQYIYVLTDFDLLSQIC